MDGFTIDTSEVDRLAVDLGRAPAKVIPQVEAVLKKGAQNVKEGMREAFEGSRYFRQVARSVSYDRRGFMSSIGYEIGPTIGGGGSLAGIAVEGGARGGGGTVEVDHVLAGESRRVLRELRKAMGDVL